MWPPFVLSAPVSKSKQEYIRLHNVVLLPVMILHATLRCCSRSTSNIPDAAPVSIFLMHTLSPELWFVFLTEAYVAASFPHAVSIGFTLMVRYLNIIQYTRPVIFVLPVPRTNQPELTGGMTATSSPSLIVFEELPESPSSVSTYCRLIVSKDLVKIFSRMPG